MADISTLQSTASHDGHDAYNTTNNRADFSKEVKDMLPTNALVIVHNSKYRQSQGLSSQKRCSNAPAGAGEQTSDFRPKTVSGGRFSGFTVRIRQKDA